MSKASERLKYRYHNEPGFKEKRLALNKKWYKENKNYVLEYNKKWREENYELYLLKSSENRRKKRSKYREIDRRYIKANPEKVKARRVIRWLVKSKVLIPPKCCSICWKTRKVEAHHDDYKEPLKIIWTCRSCHFNIHRLCK